MRPLVRRIDTTSNLPKNLLAGNQKIMASAARSSDLFLYSSVDKSDDDKKFSIDVDDSKVEFQCAQTFKVDASAYEFKSGAAFFDLDSRFNSLESSTTGADNAAAITQLQTDLAAEAVARAAAGIGSGED